MPNIKGTAIIPAVKFARKHRAKLEPFLDDAARRLLSERILAACWYPATDVTSLLEAIVKSDGSNHLSQAMELLGRSLGEIDLNGIYAHVITAGDPVRSFRRAAAVLWASYHDSGSMSFAQPNPDGPPILLRIERYEQTIPYCAIVKGMAYVVARLCGVAETARVRDTRCTLRRDDRCEIEVAW